MKKITLATILLAPLLSTANASDLSYTYVEGTVSKVEVGDVDATGVGITASAAIAKNLSLIGSYSFVASDDEFTVGGATDKSELKTSSVGFSVNFPSPVTESSDFVFSAQYFDAEADFAGSTGSGNGELYSLVLRTPVSNTTEVFGGVIHSRGAGVGAETGYSGGVRTGIHGALTGGISYTTLEEVDTASLFLRFNI